jgi:lipopolysaccharide transport system ATP-binding protein
MGSYSVTPALTSSDTHLANNYEWTDSALVFDVTNTDFPVFVGTTLLDGTFTIAQSGPQDRRDTLDDQETHP